MNIEMSAGYRLSWSVRRELWENRSIYLAPLGVALIVVVAAVVALLALPGLRTPEALDQQLVVVAIILMGVELLVAVLYCLDALYGERRDRSILFWQSLPVSDTTAVLAKAAIPILVLPVLTFAATVATQMVMAIGWSHTSPVDIVRINFVHLVVFHGIWYAPLYAWLLLASAWAPRLPLLWAVLPPVAIGVVERLVFNSTHFAGLVGSYLIGSSSMSTPDRSPMTMHDLAPHSVAHIVLSPELWVGIAVAGVFLTAAIRVRRWRGAL